MFSLFRGGGGWVYWKLTVHPCLRGDYDLLFR
jgi:hypothetical protein